MDEEPLFCDRCTKTLTPGEGSFYVVNIEAVADPTPPTISEEDLAHDVRVEISRLVDRIADLSAQEAMDQVYRRVTIYLCTPCYVRWIEKPAG